MTSTLQLCLYSRTDGAELGCWPWWATAMPLLGLALLAYLLARAAVPR